MKKEIKLIECPRDAMQGWKSFIPTQKKIEYINTLLQVGFDTIDFGSFVSHSAIPQLADTNDVIDKLNLQNTNTKLLAIIANVRGAKDAVQYDKISYLGFPFSISSTFQLRNTNSTIQESLGRVEVIKELTDKNKKELVIYISMAFGNPYGDTYNEEIVIEWVEKLSAIGINTISLADTVGLAEPVQISSILKKVIPKYPNIEFGVHLHSAPGNMKAKIEAALHAGCHRFDGALKGIGGCPMANDDLVGNMATELLLNIFEEKNILPGINQPALNEALLLAESIFK